MNIWRLHRKQQSTTPYTFDSLVIEIRKTSLVHSILDESITTLIQLTKGVPEIRQLDPKLQRHFAEVSTSSSGRLKVRLLY
jgi:hypothetical protein